MRTLATLVLLFFTWIDSFAQGAPSWLEESLHGSGKMNTVVAVVAIIIIGVGIWMFAMDARIRSMEERMNGRQGDEHQGEQK